MERKERLSGGKFLLLAYLWYQKRVVVSGSAQHQQIVLATVKSLLHCNNKAFLRRITEISWGNCLYKMCAFWGVSKKSNFELLNSIYLFIAIIFLPLVACSYDSEVVHFRLFDHICTCNGINCAHPRRNWYIVKLILIVATAVFSSCGCGTNAVHRKYVEVHSWRNLACLSVLVAHCRFSHIVTSQSIRRWYCQDILSCSENRRDKIHPRLRYLQHQIL